MVTNTDTLNYIEKSVLRPLFQKDCYKGPASGYFQFHFFLNIYLQIALSGVSKKAFLIA